MADIIQLLWSVCLFLCATSFTGIMGMSSACVRCAGPADGPCGMRNGFGGLPESPVTCPDGYCYTWAKVAPSEPPSVSRGCGPFRCSNLPPGFSDTCDSSGFVKVIPVGQQFNQTRSFSSGPQSGANQIVQSQSLQYCNDDNSCNSLPINIAVIPGQTLNSCVQCQGPSDGICGSKNIGILPKVACAENFCFTWIKVHAGSEPHVRRGCGGLPCYHLATFGANLEDRCDFNGKISPPQIFNQTQIFDNNYGAYQANGGAGNLLYCNDGNDCNSGQVSLNGIRNYYLIGAASFPLASTFLTLFSATGTILLLLA